MRIRLNIDRTPHQAKPTSYQASIIRKRLGEGSAEIPPQELIDIIETGGAFNPALMDGTSGDTWQSQQVIIADIDNDEDLRDENGKKVKDETGHVIKVPVKNPLSSERAAALCAAAGITPYCIYHTFSNGKALKRAKMENSKVIYFDSVTLEKFRIVVVLDQPITDAEEAVNITERFTNIFNSLAPGAADTTMADAARLIFGSYKGSIIINSGSITPLEVMRALPEIRTDALNWEDPIEEPAPKGQIKNNGGWYNDYKFSAQSRDYDEIKEQRRYDIENFDLYGYIMRTEAPRPHERRSGNTTYLNPCPICGHNDDFTINGHLWRCFGASGDVGGTIIDYIMHRENKTLQEALQKFDALMGYEKPKLKPEKTAQNVALEEKAEPATNETVTREEAEEMLNKYSATNYLAALNDAENQATQIKTGFSKFDEFMDGGLYPGLYILGAISSMGKTSFMVQLADQIAASGNDVMFFTLEMGARELIAKSVSRYTYLNDEENAVTANTLLMGKKRADLSTTKRVNLDKAIEKYANEVAAHSWYFESIGDKGITEIEKSVKSFMTITGRTPIIFIDYLQIMKPIEDSWTEKRNTDKNVLQLRKMARDCNTVVFAISSLNRGSYKGDIEMDAFKESGAIEYGSDVLMGLQPRGMNAGISQKEQRTNKETIDDIKQREIREIELKILKNRSGRTGKRIPLEYNTLFNLFTEPKELDTWQRFDTNNNWQETDGIYF